MLTYSRALALINPVARRVSVGCVRSPRPPGTASQSHFNEDDPNDSTGSKTDCVIVPGPRPGKHGLGHRPRNSPRSSGCRPDSGRYRQIEGPGGGAAEAVG